MTPDEIKAIESYLDALLQNKPIEPHDGPEALGGIRDRFVKLSAQLEELQQFAARLCKGNVDALPPARGNYIAAGLKQLQAQLLHLTWQAQRVAMGDYHQRVDFMGEFSDAFNEMVEQLQSRERSLRETQEVMERIFNMIESIVVVDDESESEVLYANEMAVHRFGVKIGHNEGLSDIIRHVISLRLGETEQEVFDERLKKWYGVTVRKISWSQKNNARLYYCRDITAHKERESTLDHVAHTDELTGIRNRRAFEHTYAHQWNICLKAQKPISVIVFDLDHFKLMNDTYGHINGDKMLAEFAHVLKRSVARKDDVVARYGGEEFIAALAFTEGENALKIAQTVCELTEHRKIRVTDANGADIETNLTVSAGVSSVVPKESLRPSQLVQAADYALYLAKKAGRNHAQYQQIDECPTLRQGEGS